MATILIFDEETDSCKLLKRLLERNSDQAIAFANPADALRFTESNAVDMAIVNVASRNRRSLTITADLKRINPGIKIIAITDSMPEEEIEAKSADAYLGKPIDIDTVEKKVRELLKHRTTDRD